MTIRDALKKLFNESPTWSQNKVGARLGLTNQAMSNRMVQSRRIAVDFVVACLEVMGYQLVIVPPEAKLPRGSIVIEREGDM